MSKTNVYKVSLSCKRYLLNVRLVGVEPLCPCDWHPLEWALGISDTKVVWYHREKEEKTIS